MPKKKITAKIRNAIRTYLFKSSWKIMEAKEEQHNRVVDILKKYPQYEDFPYARDLICPNCDKSGFYPPNTLVKPNLIGWCETNIGYMGVFECPLCGQKFRMHCTIGTWTATLDEFDYYLYFYAERCGNYEEIKKLLKE